MLLYVDAATRTSASNMLLQRSCITRRLPQSIATMHHRCSIFGFGGRKTPFDFFPSFFQSRQLLTRSARLACSQHKDWLSISHSTCYKVFRTAQTILFNNDDEWSGYCVWRSTALDIKAAMPFLSTAWRCMKKRQQCLFSQEFGGVWRLIDWLSRV